MQSDLYLANAKTCEEAIRASIDPGTRDTLRGELEIWLMLARGASALEALNATLARVEADARFGRS